MITILHTSARVCMIQYIYAWVSFCPPPLSSTSKRSDPLAADAGVCMSSVRDDGLNRTRPAVCPPTTTTTTPRGGLTFLGGHVDVEVEAVLALVSEVRRCYVQVSR